MNIPLTLFLAPFFGRARAYQRLLGHLESLRSDPAEHNRVCRELIGRWGLNWEKGSRESMLADYAYLSRLLGDFKLSCGSETEMAAASESIGKVDALVTIVADATNFGIEGRMMRPDAATRSAGMTADLEAGLKAISGAKGAR